LIVDCPHSTPAWTDFGFIVLRNQNIKKGRLDLSSPSFTDAEHFAGRNRRAKPTHGDIVITREAPMGDVCMVPEGLECCLGQRQVLLRPNSALVNPRFLHFALQSEVVQNQIAWSEGTGSTVSNLRIPVLKALVIPTPPRDAQDLVASTLGALDDRIDLLRKTNATLEAIAQALFKSWLVDFDPVRAKAEGREPEGMAPATAALFPGEFEESELGLVPKGWSIRSSDSFATYLNGLALQKYPPESESEFLPVIKIAQLRAGHTSAADRASASLKPEYIVRDGDVLFSWSGSLEVELWCGGPGALNQHLFKVTSAEVPKWFFYLATKHFLPGFREIAAHKATTMGHIQRKHLTEARLAMPSNDVLSAISPLFESLIDRRVCNAVQARELAELRDTLLPRLISGKLRLPEAEEAGEDAHA
jgi:type I restriction enzyme S subunit